MKSEEAEAEEPCPSPIAKLPRYSHAKLPTMLPDKPPWQAAARGPRKGAPEDPAAPAATKMETAGDGEVHATGKQGQGSPVAPSTVEAPADQPQARKRGRPRLVQDGAPAGKKPRRSAKEAPAGPPATPAALEPPTPAASGAPEPTTGPKPAGSASAKEADLHGCREAPHFEDGEEPEGEPEREPSRPGSYGAEAQPKGTLALLPVAAPVVAGPPCFAATGLTISSRQKRFIQELGGTFVEEWSPAITHLIADTFRRTTKMMCAISSGKSIVLPAYLHKCHEEGRLVGDVEFTLADTVCEAAFARKRGLTHGYTLRSALDRVRQNGPFLKGMSVYCFPSVLEKRELPLLVATAGGTWLQRWPASPDDSKVLLLAERAIVSEKERERRRQHDVYDVEILREAACTQDLRRSPYKLRRS